MDDQTIREAIKAKDMILRGNNGPLSSSGLDKRTEVVKSKFRKQSDNEDDLELLDAIIIQTLKEDYKKIEEKRRSALIRVQEQNGRFPF